EKIVKAKQYKHMTFYEAADMAKRAGVKELWLTHFSPSLVRAEDYMPQVRDIFANAYLGKDAKSVERHRRNQCDEEYYNSIRPPVSHQRCYRTEHHSE
ncbi:hypothetical protein NE450_15205, partial [[Eubacterium] rectale]|nr:hypothetical protein [Agathobacter rectalis]